MAITAVFVDGPKDGLKQEIDYPHLIYCFPSLPDMSRFLREENISNKPDLAIYEYKLYAQNTEIDIAYYKYSGER